MINLIYLTSNLKQYNINKHAVSLCWDTQKQKLFVLQNMKQYQILHSINNKPGINNCECDLSDYALKSDLKPHLDNVSFSVETKQLIFTFKLNENTYKTNVSLKDLCTALSAGKNIKIEDNVISFDGQIPQFTAGNYIEITDDDIINVKFKQLLQNLNITSNTLNVSRNDNDINIELELKAGKDISIEDNVISYTGQTAEYTAGSCISIEDNKISVNSTQVLNNLSINSNSLDVTKTNNAISIESRKLKLSDFMKIIDDESQLDNASDQFLYVILEK